MGAAAGAAVYDTPPPLLRQNPSSVPGGSAPDNGEATATWLFDVRDMFEALMGKMDTNIQSKMDGMNNKMDGNALEAKNLMKNEMKEMRGEMQRMGLDLQAGQGAQKKELEAVKKRVQNETRRDD